MLEVLTEDEARDAMGAERFDRLTAGGWLTAFYNVQGFEGRPMFPAHIVKMRLDEDLRLGSPVVEKSRKVPERVVKKLGEILDRARRLGMDI